MDTLAKELYPVPDGFPRPDWERIYEVIGKCPEETHEEEWNKVSDYWFNGILEALGSDYRRYDSTNFCVLSSEEERYSTLLIEFFERALVRILGRLEGLASDEGYGKHLSLVLSESDTY